MYVCMSVCVRMGKYQSHICNKSPIWQPAYHPVQNPDINVVMIPAGADEGINSNNKS
jgi:hypothetical protein